MNDPRTILLKALDIIGYSNDKEKFATEFLQTINAQSLMGLVNSLPAEKQKEIGQKLLTVQDDPKATGEIIQAYFTQQQMEEALKSSAQNMMTEYVKAIENTLSEEQKTNLANYFQELSQPTVPKAPTA